MGPRGSGKSTLMHCLAGLDQASGGAGQHWLLVRRHQRTRELAYYRCWTPRPVPLGTLVRVAGARWRIEQAFHAGKGLCGLDQHQVRRWRSWYRWTTLAMVALAFLAVLAVTTTPGTRPGPG
jgi:SRSO17 transposase